MKRFTKRFILMKYLYIALSFFYSFSAAAQDTASISAPSTSAPAGAAQAPGFAESMIPFVLMFVVFYFLLIRPQQKKQKAHLLQMSQLKKGDKVITAAGFAGVISKSVEGERFVDVAIADEVTVKVLRSTITELVDEEKEKAKQLKVMKPAKEPKTRQSKSKDK